ncbi:MAG: type I-C CRISPR-associated protein Cas8c/Csd1 [Lachnospiraceae bacterium]|nr:type I-C CRISPR-associated protein Cas8c/Csd1 [Lachnospiraceae bacterium]
MSWNDELYKVYDLVHESGDKELLPIAHSTANAQVELNISEEGNLINASVIDLDDAETVIPVTEDSGARGNGIFPMPLADKLLYLAGDYSLYVKGKRSDNSAYYSAYMIQLKEWLDSDHTHPALIAIYDYLSKKTLIRDLIGAGILKLDDEGCKLADGYKVNKIEQTELFVRFYVSYIDLEKEPRTWKDKSLHDCFIRYTESVMDNKGLCYATGDVCALTYKHPSKIRNSGDKAKLISANDDSGFTYRGRFASKEESFAVGYAFSQKMHNALKWLREKQGLYFGTMTIVPWASALQSIPNVLSKNTDEYSWADEEIYDSLSGYKKALNDYMLGYKRNFSVDTKIMILGLDAATTGRLSVAFYEELVGSDFLKNIEKWHIDNAWVRYDFKLKGFTIKPIGLIQVIEAAYGNEKGNYLDCDDKILRDQIMRLMPCVFEGRRIPEDLVNTLYQNASKPLSYSAAIHNKVLTTACSIYKSFLYRNRGEDISMGYDPNITDRSYLFGCLLALADKTERDTYSEDDKKRVTNARRYWASFAQNPYNTWLRIENSLAPYLNGNVYRGVIEKAFEDIMDKFDMKEFSKAERLSPMYLLGYHQYMSELYKKTKKTEETSYEKSSLK